MKLTPSVDVILGKPWLKHFNPDINWEWNIVKFTHEGKSIRCVTDRSYIEYNEDSILLPAHTFLQEFDNATAYEQLTLIGLHTEEHGHPESRDLPLGTDKEGNSKSRRVSFAEDKSHDEPRRAFAKDYVGMQFDVNIKYVKKTDLKGLQGLLEKYTEIFADPPEGVPDHNVFHKIPTDPQAPIPSPRMYCLSFKQLEELRTQLDKLLKNK
jgi:hypothetical protein